MVVPAKRLYLDVLAQHIETEAFGEGNVCNQRFVGRRGVQSVAPIALVE